jgi:hypothetical protein
MECAYVLSGVVINSGHRSGIITAHDSLRAAAEVLQELKLAKPERRTGKVSVRVGSFHAAGSSVTNFRCLSDALTPFPEYSRKSLV